MAQRLTSIVTAGLLLATPTLAAADMSGAEIIAALNAHRAANGIPAVVEDPVMTAGCMAHTQYMDLNSDISHGEIKGMPGYSQAGDAAAHDAILAGGSHSTAWSATRTPWSAQAPFHEIAAMSPDLARSGGYVRTSTTSTRYPASACLNVAQVDVSTPNGRCDLADGVMTFPGPGVTGVPPSVNARWEIPTNPAFELGYPYDATLGTHLYVYGVGPWACKHMVIDKATLIGPHGEVPTRTLDSLLPIFGFGSKTGPHWLGPKTAAMVVPTQVLEENATYTATVVVRGVGTTPHLITPKTHTWSFSTGSAPAPRWTSTTDATPDPVVPPPAAPAIVSPISKLKIVATRAKGTRVIQLTGAMPASTRTVTMSLAASGKAGRPVAIRATKKGKVALTLKVPAKAKSVVVTLADSATSWTLQKTLRIR